MIFIGLENINPDNLESVKKRQNRIEDYREMLLAWKKHPVIITCGYIIGFSNDTKASILRDVEILKRELPIDLLTLNNLTPLPGSEDHKKLKQAGAWMDPDFNKYDLNYRVTHHPKMTDQEWDEVFMEAHRAFYTFDHMAKIFRRMCQLRNAMKLTMLKMLMCYRDGQLIDRVSYAEFGALRIVRRKQRRYGLPIESPFVFYPREAWRFARKQVGYISTYVRLRVMLADIWKAWDRQDEMPYHDESLADASGADPIVQATLGRTTAYALRRQALRNA